MPRAKASPEAPTGEANPLLYMQVLRSLTEAIAEKRYPVGSRLPPESSLCRQYRVSRHTIREALRHLRDKGMISSRQGSGYTVESVAGPGGYTYAVASVDELLQYAISTRFEIERVETVKADGALAARLNCSPGRTWLHLQGLRHVGGEAKPMCWVEVFVHSSYGGIRKQVKKRTGPIYGLIEEMYGLRIEEVAQTMRAANIPESFCERLKVAPNAAALEIERVYKTSNQKVIEISFSYHPVDRFSYSLVLRRGG